MPLGQGSGMRASHLLLLAASLLAWGTALADKPALVLKGTPSHRHVHANALQTLYDQPGYIGTGVNSQNYDPAYDAYDDEAADDFFVPDGARWLIKEVDMDGYYNEGPADTFTITFYKDKHGKPGATRAQFVVVPPYYDGGGGMPLKLGGRVSLKPGHYWLSIVADQNFTIGNGQWSWASSADTFNSPAMWRNPGGGFELGCPDWGIESVCIPIGEGDHVFALKGKVR